MYTYIQLIHFAVQYKLTQYCKATVLQLKKKALGIFLIDHLIIILNKAF